MLFRSSICIGSSVISTISHLTFFVLFISSFADALFASLFVIVYTYAYSTQSPNIALLSCLLRTLGIVIHLYAQYTKLLTSDSSCLNSCHSRTQPCCIIQLPYTDVPHNKCPRKQFVWSKQRYNAGSQLWSDAATGGAKVLRCYIRAL